jgi:hypothetical protein
MSTVPVMIHIEEAEFIPVLRKIDGILGVAGIDFSLDSLKNARGAVRKQKMVQEAAISPPEAGEKPSLKQLVLALLMQGPQHLRLLKAATVKAGFAASGISSVLFDMKQKGMIESGGIGIHKLTDATLAELTAHKPIEVTPEPEPLLLEAPRKRSSPGVARYAVLAALRDANGPVKREALCESLEAVGASPNSITGILERMSNDGLIKHAKEKGFYEVTAKGRRFELPDQQRS